MKNFYFLLIAITCLFITSGCTNIMNSEIYPIEQNDKIGFINAQGKEIISPKYEKIIFNNSSNLIAVKYNGLWGFINKNNEFIIMPQFKSTEGFINNLAYVVDDNYEGYINKKGVFVWKQQKQKIQQNTNNTEHNKIQTNVKNDLADSILNELGL